MSHLKSIHRLADTLLLPRMARIQITQEQLKVNTKPRAMKWVASNIVSMTVKDGGTSSWLLMSDGDAGRLKIVSYNFLTGGISEPVVDISIKDEETDELSVIGMAYDSNEGRFFIASSSTFGAPIVRMVDEQTGTHKILSGAGVGEGPEFQNITGITLDPVGNLYVIDGGTRTIVEVDTQTGERSKFAPSWVQSHLLLYSGGLEWDSVNSRLLVVRALSLRESALLRVTGTSEGSDIETFSDSDNNGPDVDNGYRESAIDHHNGKIFLVNNSQTQLIEVDLSSGDRKVVVSDLDINYRSFISDLAYSSSTGLLYLTQLTPEGRIFALDVESGVAVGVGASHD